MQSIEEKEKNILEKIRLIVDLINIISPFSV